MTSAGAAALYSVLCLGSAGLVTAANVRSGTGGAALATAVRPGPPDRVTVAFVGDVLMHDSLQVQAAQQAAGLGFASLWYQVDDGLAAADITYANLEGPVAEGVRCDGRISAAPPAVSFAKGSCIAGNGDAVYTGYPRFNSPPELLQALAAAGVDVVSTANNHALDRGRVGVLRTLEALDRTGLAHAGTRRSEKEPPYALTRVRSARGRMTIAWLACTYGTNGMTSGADLVTPCFDEQSAPSSGLLAAVRRLAGDPRVDAVIVTPHWGVEYRHVPNAAQESLATDLVAAGATAVIGAHPHVVQPVQVVTAGGRQAVVAYSLGNFVSAQTEPARRVGLLLYVDLVRAADGAVQAEAARYVPLFMARDLEGAPMPWTLSVLGDDVPGDAAAEARRVVRGTLDQAWQGTLEPGRGARAAVEVLHLDLDAPVGPSRPVWIRLDPSGGVPHWR